METDRLDPVDRSRAWEPSDCNWPEFRQQTTSGLDKGDILMITPTRWQFKKKKNQFGAVFFLPKRVEGSSNPRAAAAAACCCCCCCMAAAAAE